MNEHVTAVTLSRTPLVHPSPALAHGCRALNHVARFQAGAGYQAAFLDALAKVETEWFFFLDSDDELPGDFSRVLGLCLTTGSPLAYTDEMVTSAHGTRTRRVSVPYTQDVHVANAMLLHHLVVCKTRTAHRAAAVIPRGDYTPEHMLFFQAAKEGAKYVPEVGYIWHRRSTGLNAQPLALISQVRSRTWANRNRD